MIGSGNTTHTQQPTARESFNVLVVDDSYIMRRILKGCMELVTSGTVYEAGDGPETLLRLKEHPEIQLIFLDWLMPNVDGITVLRQIRTTHDKQALPVIMVTTQSSRDNVLEALGAGANHYIIKPFKQDRLLEAVKVTLAKAHA
jgi:two-component system, chemotaxis family, chemotaxis protein CheY